MCTGISELWTSHLISIILRYFEIAADCTAELKLPSVSTLCLGPCSEQVKKTVRSISVTNLKCSSSQLI
jgi:hypothetical protein